MEISVLDKLPNNNEIVWCFGNATYCCKLDMEESPTWYLVKFSFDISSYKIKKEIPLDSDESILEDYKIVESWKIISDSKDVEYPNERIINVIKWKKLEK